MRFSAFLQLGAAIPLGIYAATVCTRLQFLGITAAGAVIALVGGAGASVLAAVSALLQWVMAQPGVAAHAAPVRALHLAAVAVGGVGFLAMLGLLLAGVSVVCYFTRFLPRWLVWLGLAGAALAEVSSLHLIIPDAAFLLPTARLAAMIWLIGAGFKLPRSRAAAQRQRRAALGLPIAAGTENS